MDERQWVPFSWEVVPPQWTSVTNLRALDMTQEEWMAAGNCGPVRVKESTWWALYWRTSK